MYLSKLLLNPQNSEARRDLQSAYELHRTLMRIYPDNDRSDRMLFRIEWQEASQRGIPVLVQTNLVKANWQFLLERNYLIHVEGPKEYHPKLVEGNQFFFRLLANPTKKNEGKRKGLYREEEQLAWLQRKETLHGFSVIQSYLQPEPTFAKRTKYGKDNKMNHFGVLFQGILEVTNPVTFSETLQQGIGSAKGMGYGLLSIKK